MLRLLSLGLEYPREPCVSSVPQLPSDGFLPFW
jgi:hypothetical protein